MKFVALAALFAAASFAQAQSPATLRTGPELVDSIPLDPVQIVSAWKARYLDSGDNVWVYATSSVYFRPVGVAVRWGSATVLRSRTLDADDRPYTAWTLTSSDPNAFAWTFFFPEDAFEARVREWIADFQRQFRTLEKIEPKGARVLFPAVVLDR